MGVGSGVWPKIGQKDLFGQKGPSVSHLEPTLTKVAQMEHWSHLNDPFGQMSPKGPKDQGPQPPPPFLAQNLTQKRSRLAKNGVGGWDGVSHRNTQSSEGALEPSPHPHFGQKLAKKTKFCQKGPKGPYWIRK